MKKRGGGGEEGEGGMAAAVETVDCTNTIKDHTKIHTLPSKSAPDFYNISPKHERKDMFLSDKQTLTRSTNVDGTCDVLFESDYSAQNQFHPAHAVHLHHVSRSMHQVYGERVLDSQKKKRRFCRREGK